MPRRIAFAPSGKFIYDGSSVSRCARAFSRTNVTEPPRCRVTIARNDPRFPARGATYVRVRAPHKRARARKRESGGGREREHTRVTQRPFERCRVYRRFLSLYHTRRPFERPARRTVYQRFYRVLPLARTHDLSIGRFVTSITGQAIEPYKRRVDYAFSTIYNRDRYPANRARIGKR